MIASMRSDDIMCSGGKGLVSKEECLACALSRKNNCGMDYGLLRFIYKQEGKVRTGIHVTDLVGCLRRSWYDKTTRITTYPHELMYIVIGAAAHAVLEGDDEHMETELELSANGLEGKTDVHYRSPVYTESDGRLVDYKTTRWLKPSAVPYGDHKLQLNIYRYLVELTGKEVKSLQVQYIDMSGPTRCRKCKVVVMPNEYGQPYCPSCGKHDPEAHFGAVLCDIPLMDIEEVEQLVELRKSALELSLKNENPPDREVSWLCNYCKFAGICKPSIG